MMRQFEKAFAEPHLALYKFHVEMRGDSAVLTLTIDTDIDGSSDVVSDKRTLMKWVFNTVALEWPESAKLLRETFVQPLISVKEQLQLQKMDLAEMIAKGEATVGAAAKGGQMRNATSWRASYKTNGADDGSNEFKLELFDQNHVEVRHLMYPCSSLHHSEGFK